MFWGGQVKQFFTRGEQTAAVFKGLDRTILWTTGNSVYLLTGTIAMDELKQAVEAIQWAEKTFHKNFRIFSSLSTPSAGIIDRSIRRGGFSMAGQMFSKNNFKNLFLLFFIICQFGAIVSDSHIWGLGRLSGPEYPDRSVRLSASRWSTHEVLPAKTPDRRADPHRSHHIHTLARLSGQFYHGYLFWYFGLLGNLGIYSDPEIWLVKEIELLPGCKRTERSHKTSMANT